MKLQLNREKLGLLVKALGKQTSLAENIGVDPTQISRYLNGHRDVCGDFLIQILNEVGIDIDKLVTTKLKSVVKIEDINLRDAADSALFLFKEMTPLSQAITLRNMLIDMKFDQPEKIKPEMEIVIRKQFCKIGGKSGR